MRGEILFEKMTHISDAYVEEAAFMPSVGAPRRKGVNGHLASLSRALNSGWGVASICLLVAIGAIVGMVAWGRMSDPTDPTPSDDPAVRFTFGYTILPVDGVAVRGDTVTVETSIINRGNPFTYEGASSEFCAHAQFVLQGDESVSLHGTTVHTNDIGTFTVETEEAGQGTYTFIIPEDAVTGVYDLVLSYDHVRQVYKGVLTVEESPQTDTTDHPFSFGYEPFLSGPISAGTELILEAWVVNGGQAFTYEGASNAFKPTAYLVHDTTGYRILGETSVTTDYSTITVLAGQKGTGSYTFPIPADAPAGDYSLLLSYGEIEQTFAQVLTVANKSDGFLRRR